MKSVIDPKYWGDAKPPQEQIRISQAVLDAAAEVWDQAPDPCGCRTFYTPQEWMERKEKYAEGAELIICHDGGDFAPLINLDYESYALHDKFQDALKRRLPEFYIEPCTCWYAAVYEG